MSSQSPEIDCNHDNAHYNRCPDCNSITCDYCEDYGFKNMRGLMIHVVKMHKEESSAISQDAHNTAMEENYHDLGF